MLDSSKNKCATIRRILKNHVDNGYVVYLENCFHEVFVDYINNEKRNTLKTGDIVELIFNCSLSTDEDDLEGYYKIGQILG